jgi:hypothetical protein
MRKILLLAFIFSFIFSFIFPPLLLRAQSTNIVTIPPAPIVHFCNAPANAVPCTNYATTYTDSTLSTACPTTAQIVLDGTNTCVTSPDAQNNWGVWAACGATAQYTYTITIGTTNFGPYYVTVPCNLTTNPTITNPTITGTVSGGANYTVPTITNPTITNPTTTGTDNGTETLASKTLGSPVVNGTPTGTGIATSTQLMGDHTTTYSSASTTLVAVDGTNLSYTVTIPTGWKLFVWASGLAQTLTAAITYNIAMVDGSTVLQSIRNTPSAVGVWQSFHFNPIVTGDGASHTIQLQYLTTNAADSVTVRNDATGTANDVPVMSFMLLPSN